MESSHDPSQEASHEDDVFGGKVDPSMGSNQPAESTQNGQDTPTQHEEIDSLSAALARPGHSESAQVNPNSATQPSQSIQQGAGLNGGVSPGAPAHVEALASPGDNGGTSGGGGGENPPPLIDHPYEEALQRPVTMSGSYKAALLLTGSIVPLPIIVAIITATIYITRPDWGPLLYVPTKVLILLGSLAITLLLWLLISLPFESFTTFENANAQSCTHLMRHLLALKSGLTLLRELFSREKVSPSSELQEGAYSLISFRNAYPEDYELALETVCESLIAVNKQLASKDQSLSWTMGVGYLKAWYFVHQAEEAMLDIAPREYVIREALHDESAINGSSIASSDYVLSNIRTAVKTLSPSAAAYLKSLPVQDRDMSPDTAPTDHSLERGTVPDVRIELEARNALRDAKQTLDEFRASLWDGLVRIRNQLVGTALITGLLTYILLCVAISVDVNVESMKAAVVFYLVGASVGLFSRLYTESQTDSAIDDYGLTAARLVVTPVLSGLAAIAGVLVVAVLSFNVLSAPGSTPASGGLPQLKDIYDLVQNRQGIVLAAAFGLTPNLFLNVLQQKTDNTKAQLKSTSPPNQSKP